LCDNADGRQRRGQLKNTRYAEFHLQGLATQSRMHLKTLLLINMPGLLWKQTNTGSKTQEPLEQKILHKMRSQDGGTRERNRTVSDKKFRL